MSDDIWKDLPRAYYDDDHTRFGTGPEMIAEIKQLRSEVARLRKCEAVQVELIKEIERRQIELCKDVSKARIEHGVDSSEIDVEYARHFVLFDLLNWIKKQPASLTPSGDGETENQQ